MYKKAISLIKNKYIFTSLAFIIWMLFFDKHNLVSQFKLTNNLKQSQQIKEYYLQEIEKDSIATRELMTNDNNLEKFAREKYLLKKDNEDIFLIVTEENDR